MRTSANPAFIILVVVAIHASPLCGQKQPKPSSPDGPRVLETTKGDARWWTLTDEITPQELRAIHEDVELHKKRYLEAIEAGTQQWYPNERTEPPIFFIDGRTRPELFQMWSVFDAFAIGFGSEMGDPRASLAEFGFAGEALDTIVHFSSEYWRERQLLMEKLIEEAQPALTFVRRGRESLGEENFKAANKVKDVSLLANATGYSVEQIEKIFEARARTPAQDFAARALPLLKELLKPTDWDLFRLYLLEVQATMMISMSTAVS